MQFITESNNFIFIRDGLKAGSRNFALLFFFVKFKHIYFISFICFFSYSHYINHDKTLQEVLIKK